MANILLIEDSPTCYFIVSKALSSLDANMIWAKTVSEGLSHLENLDKPIAIVLLDLVLPDGDGLTLLDRLQKDPNLQDIQVLALTSREDLASKVSAFSLGADDYLTKPVDPVELRARVEMRLKKIAKTKRQSDMIKRGRLTINMPLMRTSITEGGDPRTVDLTAKEFKILAFLARNENQMYSRAQLVKAIWGDDTHVVERTVDSHVCGLRRKLGNYGQYVENIPGSGYRFVVKD